MSLKIKAFKTALIANLFVSIFFTNIKTIIAKAIQKKDKHK